MQGLMVFRDGLRGRGDKSRAAREKVTVVVSDSEVDHPQLRGQGGVCNQGTHTDVLEQHISVTLELTDCDSLKAGPRESCWTISSGCFHH